MELVLAAAVLVHPSPLVGTEAFLTVTVFDPLYVPGTGSAFLGANVMVQPLSYAT